MKSTGEMIWQTSRGLNEAVMLLEHMAKHIRDAGGSPEQVHRFLEKAQELNKRAMRFEEFAHANESMSGNKLEESADE